MCIADDCASHHQLRVLCELTPGDLSRRSWAYAAFFDTRNILGFYVTSSRDEFENTARVSAPFGTLPRHVALTISELLRSSQNLITRIVD